MFSELVYIHNLIKKTESNFVPVGFNCGIAHYLREHNLRKAALPFDWNITPLNVVGLLIESNFEGFLEKENLKFNPAQYRQYFDEHGNTLVKKDQYITPVVCERYKMLFPHDFTENGEIEFDEVSSKYKKRIERFQKLVEDKKQPVCFIYSLGFPNDWQMEQYSISNVDYPNINRSDLKALKKMLRPFFVVDFWEFKILHANSSLIMGIIQVYSYRVKRVLGGIFKSSSNN